MRMRLKVVLKRYSATMFNVRRPQLTSDGYRRTQLSSPIKQSSLSLVAQTCQSVCEKPWQNTNCLGVTDKPASDLVPLSQP